MPTIVTQTQLDSPVSCDSEEHDGKYLKVRDDSHTVTEDLTIIKDSVVDKASIPRTFPLWTSFIKKRSEMSFAAECALAVPNSKRSSVNLASDSTASSLKKRRSIFVEPRAPTVSVDPADLRLAQKIHHDELMQLHEHFKKKQKDAKPEVSAKDVKPVVLVKNQISTHGLAPMGMSIPEKGEAYVIRVNDTVKEPLVESHLEMYNRFKEEEEGAKKKKEKKEVKKLKKDGKVRTLAPYMFS